MIIQSDDKRTLPEVFEVSAVNQIYNSKIPGIFDDNPAYVLIGDVYASLLITGDTSWDCLVKGSTEKFTVIGGRHGNIINPVGYNGYMDYGDLATDVKDPAHIQGDYTLAKPYGSRVKVLNLARIPHLQTMEGLQKQVRLESEAGRKVIFSWCYGIFTYCETINVNHGDDVSNPAHRCHTMWRELLEYTVAELTDTFWP